MPCCGVPGYDGTVGLSGVDPTFDTVKMSTQIWKIKFASILGVLRDDLTKKYESDVARKYLFGHRGRYSLLLDCV